MNKRIHAFLSHFLQWPEPAVYGALIISSFIGLWPGFPLTTVGADEMFPGAVFRSNEQQSLVPQGIDVLYGTLTYYLTYAGIVAMPGALMPFAAFSVSALKTYVLTHM